MARQRDNLFGSFGLAVAEREQAQRRIEAEVTGQAVPEPMKSAKPKTAVKTASLAVAPKPGAVGRPRKRANPVSMTISIDQADKDLVKEYAFVHSVTVSDLIHTWIRENCVE